MLQFIDKCFFLVFQNDDHQREMKSTSASTSTTSLGRSTAQIQTTPRWPSHMQSPNPRRSSCSQRRYCSSENSAAALDTSLVTVASSRSSPESFSSFLVRPAAVTLKLIKESKIFD
ncbi:hypothetical protein J437_LFUL010106 [Ladona fulva]|uniref:Uncharacterized protein n=1 Tax=Ladona fulva TaxID=123851 RepID=A0A8K0P3L7_LADFU|nr:hypothetical protein J437_LFUL010106 [Ladona fulva]